MPTTARLSRPAASLLLSLVLISGVGFAYGQLAEGEFVTSKAASAWQAWDAAMEALLARDRDAAEKHFGELLALEPSPLRVAMLAERSVKRNINAGGVLLFEQDVEADTIGDNGKKVFTLLDTGREQLNEADDGWYFASIGRFGIANANFEALLASKPDPVALLEFADRVPRRQKILVQLAGDPILGESVTKILGLLQRGEEQIKADPTRIRENIARLGGPPRAYENAAGLLKDSGEYAIPFLIETLRDSSRKNLVRPILRTLPKIGHAGLNAMVIGLRVPDPAVKRFLVDALGEIGYWQAVPYLMKLRDAPGTTPAVRAAIQTALQKLASRGLDIPANLTTADAFYQLAQAYYDDQESLRADPRLDAANVWYWNDDILQNVPVPTPIFNEIMCMRCCEEALLADPDHRAALALWIAANFRREAQLPEGRTDHTRPADYPTALYFAQSAGSSYCQMALARGLDKHEPAVALGTILALRTTAGPASLLAGEGDRTPLAEALAFPDRMVRVRAGLVLGNALPSKPFQGQQNLMPVLSEALMLYGGGRNALIVNPSEEHANATAGILRDAGYEVLIAASLLPGLEQARHELPGLDVIVLAADISKPDLPGAIKQLDADISFSATPVIITAAPGHLETAETLAQANPRIELVPETPTAEEMSKAISAAAKATGATQITPELGVSLALEAAQTIELLALSDNPLFDIHDAQPALLAALKTDDATLKATVAHVLGYMGTQEAQQAVARLALDTKQPEAMRVTMFGALAEAAKRTGNHLPDDMIKRIITIAESEKNMTIRTAASETLGALDLPGNPASVIIRNQYGG